MPKDNKRKGLHIHRTHPILFGGNPLDRQNIILVTRQQHSELATFWNRKLREIKSQPNATTT